MASVPQESSTGSSNASDSETLPRQFGKYTLLRRLAAGGMAELFLALQRSVAGFEKLIVIKRILPSMTQDQGFVEMLLHEARIAATLSHPNIVQIFDVGQIDGVYFIAMEHIHGEDIRGVVRAMKKNNVSDFPLEHALTVVLGVCAGLAYAHEKRNLDGVTLDIVHRDISPQNIVVTFTGDVKIVDFGIAKSDIQGASEDTHSGQIKGKVAYMSPEQAAGQHVDWRSDIFAAGVMLFELTTGRRLFKGGSEFETLKLICDREYPRPSEVRPGYPLALERIVMRALAKKREERYQSAREMQGDLEAFIREERIAASTVSLTRWMQSLFADKLAQQKEALQDVKQLADVIAKQSETTGHFDATVSGVTAAGASPSMLPATANKPASRSRTGLYALLATVVLGAAGASFMYLKHQSDVREQEAAAAKARQEADKAKVAPAEVEQRGSLKIDTKPDGCSVWINGDLQRDLTPTTIEGLPLGRELDLKLTKEGLEAYREKVTLSADAPTKSVSATMEAGSVTVLLKVTPQPTIWLDGKQWQGGDPHKLSGISAGEEHKMVLSAPGYLPKTVTFTAQPGESRTIEETLVKGDAKAAETTTAKSGDKPAAVGGSGTVRVGAKGGYCNVTINGTSYGPTPTQATVPAGNARVTCKPPSGASQTQGVKVEPNGTARVFFSL